MTYRATAATVGNSRALRVDSALFRAHPEFAVGEFDVSVIAPGRMLVQATSDPPANDTDPVLDAFLAYLEDQMVRRPDLITSVTAGDRREADELVRGVAADPDQDLGDDFSVPDTASTSTRRRHRRQVMKK